jgi:hypothetical protein
MLKELEQGIQEILRQNGELLDSISKASNKQLLQMFENELRIADAMKLSKNFPQQSIDHQQQKFYWVKRELENRISEHLGK